MAQAKCHISTKTPFKNYQLLYEKIEAKRKSNQYKMKWVIGCSTTNRSGTFIRDYMIRNSQISSNLALRKVPLLQDF